MNENLPTLPGRPASIRSLLLRPVTRWLLRPAVSGPGLTHAQRREKLDYIARMTQLWMPGGSDFRSGLLGDVKIEWVSNLKNGTDGFVLYLHGGKYTVGSPVVYRGLTARLAAKAGVSVAVADYRLAPEHPFPAAVEDALAAYRALLDQNIPASKIVLAGDSAGGGLALACALWAHAGQLPRPAGIICLCPWTDLSLSGESITRNQPRDVVLTGDILRESCNHYLKGAEVMNPLASPLFADLSALPPLLIQTTNGDILEDDGHRLAAAAREQGVKVQHEHWPNLWHDWQVLAGQLPEADWAIDRMAGFIRECLKPA